MSSLHLWRYGVSSEFIEFRDMTLTLEVLFISLHTIYISPHKLPNSINHAKRLGLCAQSEILV